MRAAVNQSRGRIWPAALFAFILSCLLLGASASPGQNVSLTWNPGPSGANTGYFIYYGFKSGNYSAKIDVGTNTVATLTGLTIGQTCYFVVTAYNSARIESLPSNEASFVVPNTSAALAPLLAAVSPSSAPPGAQVLIYGANLNTANSVQFNGVSAPFAVSSGDFLVATVPAGAKTGPLAVSSASGTVSFHFVVVPGPPPANDNFNSAQTLSGTMAVISTNTIGATKQSGEPNHAGNAGGSSVWYRWTAPASGTWFLNTTGSSFTTLLAVYTGNAVTSLSLVTNNLAAPGIFTNSFTFTAVAGVTYQIAVDGYAGAAGQLILNLAPAPAPTTTVYAASFESAYGFFSSLALSGQAGWLSSGTATTGIKVNAFPGYGQQGYIGFGSANPGISTLLYVPLNYTVNTNSSPLIQFSVMMQLNAPVISPYNDTFGWVVRNASGQQLFSISFDDYAKTVSTTLNDGNGASYAGITFNNSSVYNLTITMDFSHNLWSASLSGTLIASGLPISANGAALTLGDIDASEAFRVPSLPGSDGMVFDNYLVTAGPSPAPAIMQAPRSQTVAAGNTTFLGAVVSGAPPLSYQWYANNTPISGATNSGLYLTALTTANYVLAVASPYGSTSASAMLTVTNPPPKSLFSAPLSLGSAGATLNLTVAAGNNYEFQASTNLHDWVTLGSFFAMGTNAVCFDSAATNSPCRFYRLVSP